MSAGHDFSTRLIVWQRGYGRHDLPWQGNRDPYRIWVSEIMLQQTQAATVVGYFERFLQRFPDVGTLAAASLDAVLAEWSGLGYYQRARNLHRAACRIVAAGGVFPTGVAELAALPGVGRSTAAAVSVFSAGTRAAILDGNVRRVLARCFAIEGYPGDPVVAHRLWALAESLLPDADIEAYTQGLMDLGALCCTRYRPRCPECPVREHCLALRQGRVTEWPAPRPRSPVVEQALTWLLIREGRQRLLVRRPARGIWGGLWAPPEPAPGADAVVWCHDVLGLPVVDCGTLPELRHSLTHRRLCILPRCLEVTSLPVTPLPPGYGWFDPAAVAVAGLPAPARKLLVAG